MQFSMAETAAMGGGERNREREYRKGNWTVHETLVLITGKKMDDERRLRRVSESEGRSRPAEQRWKWVEDYCWKNGCLRSQNQCNDKWDNLMRDYKKVRDYERRVGEEGGVSYWKMEKQERKDRNLPTNLLPQIFEALVEVVEKKGLMVHVGQKELEIVGASNVPSSVTPALRPHLPNPSLLPPPPCPQATLLHPPITMAQAMPTLGAESSDSDKSESSTSTEKRRRGEGSSSTSSTMHHLCSAISESASIIERALLQCEEREEKRHKELLNLEERKLKVEESKAEINLQAINGLTGAINQLADSIFALASDRNQTDPKS